jgi:hypothetical protein
MSREARCQLFTPLLAQAQSHAELTIVRLLLGLLLLLLSSWGISGSGVTTGGGTTSSSSGGGTTTTDVQEHVLEVLAIEGLGEECAPDGLDIRDLGGSDEGLELVRLQGKRLLVRVLVRVCILCAFANAAIGFRSFAIVEELTYGDLNTVIGEDEGGVGSGELRVRHREV